MCVCCVCVFVCVLCMCMCVCGVCVFVLQNTGESNFCVAIEIKKKLLVLYCMYLHTAELLNSKNGYK